MFGFRFFFQCDVFGFNFFFSVMCLDFKKISVWCVWIQFFFSVMCLDSIFFSVWCVWILKNVSVMCLDSIFFQCDVFGFKKIPCDMFGFIFFSVMCFGSDFFISVRISFAFNLMIFCWFHRRSVDSSWKLSKIFRSKLVEATLGRHDIQHNDT